MAVTDTVQDAGARLTDARAEIERRYAELEAVEAEKADAERAWFAEAEAEAGEETQALREKRDAYHRAELREREAKHRIEQARRRVEEADRDLEAARESEQRAQLRSLSEKRLRLAQKIDRTAAKLARELSQYFELADDITIARVGIVGGPSSRQVRGVHVGALVCERLWRVLPKDIRRSSGYREYTLPAFERRVLAPWLRNGPVGEAETTDQEEVEVERS
jgi:hypothetical protein